MEKNLSNIEDANYLGILIDYLNNDEILEILYFVYLEMIDKKEDVSSLFKEKMVNFFLTNHQLFFEIIAKTMSNNNLDRNDFYHLTTYNYYFKDWKIDNNILTNDDKRVDDFFDKEPYAFLSNVDVYVLRSANSFCLAHVCTEYNSLEYYPIELNNIESQLNLLKQKINSEFD
ncbi:hypothetical protein V7S76_06345 [Aquirufa sp. ROCK2-A2]